MAAFTSTLALKWVVGLAPCSPPDIVNASPNDSLVPVSGTDPVTFTVSDAEFKYDCVSGYLNEYTRTKTITLPTGAVSYGAWTFVRCVSSCTACGSGSGSGGCTYDGPLEACVDSALSDSRWADWFGYTFTLTPSGIGGASHGPFGYSGFAPAGPGHDDGIGGPKIEVKCNDSGNYHYSAGTTPCVFQLACGDFSLFSTPLFMGNYLDRGDLYITLGACGGGSGSIPGGALCHHWAFENNLNDSIGSNTGTGAVSYTAGHSGQALLVGASSGEATFINDTCFANSNITVECWVKKPVFSTAEHPIISKTNVASEFRLYLTGGSIALIVWGSLGNTLVFGGSCSAGTWYHIVFTYSTATGARLYVNGSLAGGASSTGTRISASGSDFVVGADGSGNWFDGLIDEVKVYNHELTAAEVAAL